jgi:hypothetical protein
MSWRSEPGCVEKHLDEVWVGVKGQSNPEIARSPRNSFRTSLDLKCHGGRALIGLGPSQGYRPLLNSECRRHDDRESAYVG